MRSIRAWKKPGLLANPIDATVSCSCPLWGGGGECCLPPVLSMDGLLRKQVLKIVAPPSAPNTSSCRGSGYAFGIRRSLIFCGIWRCVVWCEEFETLGFTSEKRKICRSVFVEATSSTNHIEHLVFAIAVTTPVETDIIVLFRPMFVISSSIPLDMRI